jgi:HSP20 family protein
MKVWSLYATTDRSPEACQAWRPPVDIYRRGQEWLLKFDLAGVRPEDVQVCISGSRITVAGVRRDWVVEQGYSYHSMEISYNRFERSIELPGDLSDADYALEARDGLLLVHVGAPNT